MKLMRQPVRPQVELLEDRAVPASVVTPSGLSITTDVGLLAIAANPAKANDGNVTLTITGTATVSKFDPPGAVVRVQNGGFVQSFSNITVIRYVGDTEANDVKLDLNGFTLSGDFLFSGGKGNDSVTISNGTFAGKVVIDGGADTDTITVGTDVNVATDLRIRTGLGNDTVNVGDTIGGNLEVFGGVDAVAITASQVNVTGDLRITTGKGNDSITVDGGTIMGNLNVISGFGDDTVLLGTFTSGQALTVVGAVTANDVGGTVDALSFGGSNATPSVFQGPVSARGYNFVPVGNDGQLTFMNNVGIQGDNNGMLVQVNGGGAANPVAINGRLTVNGGTGADTVTFFDADVVSGLATLNLGAGSAQFGGGTANFNAGLMVNAGLGINTFNLGSMQVTGNATFLDRGVFGTFDLSGAFSVSRNLTLTSSANNDLTIGVAGTVGGNLTFNLGNGNNGLVLLASAMVQGDVTFQLGSGNNTMDDLPGTTLGGLLRVRTGGGNNAYTARRAGSYQLDLFFGGGNDSFTYAGAGAALAGILVGNGGMNTFMAGAATTTNLRTFGFA